MAGFGERIVRAARLDANIYEEIEADRGALGQALCVVVLSSIAAGIGSIHGGLRATSGGWFGGLILGSIFAVIGWFIWAYLIYFIGAKLLPEPQTKADPGQLLRTIGFSSSPGLIRVLGLIPGIAAVVFVVAAVWMIAAMIVAVRQALDYSGTWRAVGVTLLAWLAQALIIAVIFALFGGHPAA